MSSDQYSSMFHNRNFLESSLKSQLQMERMPHWHNFIKKGIIIVPLSPARGLPVL